MKIKEIKDAEEISLNYRIPIFEVVFCELNRTGVFFQGNQVPVGFRVRFFCNEIFSLKPSLKFLNNLRECF